MHIINRSQNRLYEKCFLIEAKSTFIKANFSNNIKRENIIEYRGLKHKQNNRISNEK